MGKILSLLSRFHRAERFKPTYDDAPAGNTVEIHPGCTSLFRKCTSVDVTHLADKTSEWMSRAMHCLTEFTAKTALPPETYDRVFRQNLGLCKVTIVPGTNGADCPLTSPALIDRIRGASKFCLKLTAQPRDPNCLPQLLGSIGLTPLHLTVSDCNAIAPDDTVQPPTMTPVSSPTHIETFDGTLVLGGSQRVAAALLRKNVPGALKQLAVDVSSPVELGQLFLDHAGIESLALAAEARRDTPESKGFYAQALFSCALNCLPNLKWFELHMAGTSEWAVNLVNSTIPRATKLEGVAFGRKSFVTGGPTAIMQRYPALTEVTQNGCSVWVELNKVLFFRAMKEGMSTRSKQPQGLGVGCIAKTYTDS